MAIVFIVALWIISLVIAVAIGSATDPDWPHPESRNGWGVRWFKHLWCGMVNGHEWEDVSPLLDQGVKFKRCKKCGKERMF